jgi:hypothetical protein
MASSLLLLLVDGCTVVLVGWGGEESSNLSLDFLLLDHEKPESLLVVWRGIHVARRSLKRISCCIALLSLEACRAVTSAASRRQLWIRFTPNRAFDVECERDLQLTTNKRREWRKFKLEFGDK